MAGYQPQFNVPPLAAVPAQAPANQDDDDFDRDLPDVQEDHYDEEPEEDAVHQAYGELRRYANKRRAEASRDQRIKKMHKRLIANNVMGVSEQLLTPLASSANRAMQRQAVPTFADAKVQEIPTSLEHFKRLLWEANRPRLYSEHVSEHDWADQTANPSEQSNGSGHEAGNSSAQATESSDEAGHPEQSEENNNEDDLTGESSEQPNDEE